MKRAVVGCLTLCSFLVPALIPSPALGQTRDVQRPQVGSASISGVVVTDASSPRPVRRVIVELAEVNGAKAPLGAITDDAGQFTFRDLPPGTYTLVASRATYVSSAYGAKTYGRGSGVPISIAAGQVIKDLTLKMIRGGVITGVLRDPAGRPVSNAEMILMAARTDTGRRKLTPVAQNAQTNSRGEYRVFGLPPGEYVVRAQPPSRNGQPELRQTTAADVEWARLRAASSGSAGATAGGATDPAPPGSRPVTYAASYYPGTADIATSSPVTVAAGEERTGIDFGLQLIPTATISGRVSTPDGLPPTNASATLQLQTSTAASFIDRMIGIAQSGGFGIGGGMRVGPDGKFSVSGIAPGRYKMTLRGAPAGPEGTRGRANEMAALAGMMPGMAAATGSTLWAIEEFSINGQDVTDLDVRLQPGMSMTGTVVFEGDDAQKPVDAARMQIALNVADQEITTALDIAFSMFSGVIPGKVQKDRTFQVDGLAPGRYRASALPPGVMNPFMAFGAQSPDGWVLKSIVWNGRDIADGAIDIRQGDDLTGVVVTFTKAVTEISGRLLDATGKPTSGLPIVVFSTKPADWPGGTRRVVSAKPASDGTFKVTGLPAGDYYICALIDLDKNDLYDPSFLEQLVASSFRITLADGEKKKQDLRLGGGL